MATGPKIALTPLELLEGQREPPFLSKIWNPVIWGTMGFVSVIVANYMARKPVFSGVQKHIGAVVICSGIGKVVDDYRNKYLADKDAVLRHYIQLHPEEFPPFERKQFKDVLEPWYPIR
ncbi:NADH dehydrogenase [ubiquinone] 1 subunit C2 [Diorhabda carinulata]|uniref:NADH dehydrogenase [ubiquinone] 1 subunit C2 n=1 Tax=Diorhabda sublineata TaxID=1163346 RepID=UPI0024E193A4|nr:NADH dehydrogenase [ubiquinone] 1 subunit C2 [Diorhabda sublineata]XP_057668947.1 NADH dehydrogenase [ubiquinone] 1 subunit C2 [Diorhabda carinulata]